MTDSLERKIFFGFSLVALILVVLAFFAFSNNRSYEQTNQMVAHTDRVLFGLERLHSMSINVETGVRGFALTKDTIFLQPYYTSIKKIDSNLIVLRNLLADNPEQCLKLDSAERTIRNKISTFNDLIESFKGRKNRLLPDNFWYDSKFQMDNIRSILAAMKSTEMKLLSSRKSATEKSQNGFLILLAGSFVFMALTLGVVYRLIYVNLKALTESENKLKTNWKMFQAVLDKAPAVISIKDITGKYLMINNQFLKFSGRSSSDILNRTLYEMLPLEEAKKQDEWDQKVLAQKDLLTVEMTVPIHDHFRTYIVSKFPLLDEQEKPYAICTISTDITERKENQEKIEDLNRELQQNILQLEYANKELESFTYSVSHDLRAPLRSIDGYSRILEEDYANKLDDEGKRVLTIVLNNAKRMADLIDALLTFSRIGKLDASKVNVNMKELVSEVLCDFNNVNAHLSDLPPAKADLNMMRQVWVNLISNAIKYSSKQAVAHIEIGSLFENGKAIYFIKDNGIGFDMKYAHKLFGVFQRLHSMEEFEGTGVGLAMVQRIIHKHGGEIWAKSTPCEGATFYFHLS